MATASAAPRLAAVGAQRGQLARVDWHWVDWHWVDRRWIGPRWIGARADDGEPAPEDLPAPDVLTGTDLIERELGGRIIQELDGP